MRLIFMVLCSVCIGAYGKSLYLGLGVFCFLMVINNSINRAVDAIRQEIAYAADYVQKQKDKKNGP